MAVTFGYALIQALKSTGTSVADLHRATGVSDQQIHKVKQGKSRSTNVDDAVKIARFFGKSLDEFLEGDDPDIRSDVELTALAQRLDDRQIQKLLGFGEGLLADQDRPQKEDGEEEK